MPELILFVLAAGSGLKYKLRRLIEPDYGLLDHLLSILTREQVAEISHEPDVYKRNDKMLSFVHHQYEWEKLITALKATGQEHVANFTNCHGGLTNKNLPQACWKYLSPHRPEQISEGSNRPWFERLV